MNNEDLLKVIEAQQIALIAMQKQILELASSIPLQDTAGLIKNADELAAQLSAIKDILSKYAG